MKLANIGDIVLDNFGRRATVIGSTKKTLTLAYPSSTMKLNYNPAGMTLAKAGLKLLAEHEQVLKSFN